MKKLLLLIVAFVCLFTVSGMAQANEPQCSKGTCYGLGEPSGLCYLGGVYTQIDASAGHNLWACTTKNGVSGWTLQTGGGGSATGSSGAVQGSDGAGAFTDTGVSVSSGNVSVAAGKSVGSADTGTPKFTFSTNLITASKPLNAPSITTGTPPASAGATATGGTACTEAANTGWTPTAGEDYDRCDNTLHRKVLSNNGGAETAIVGLATTDTLTNKTLDAEGTGNVLTIPVKVWLAGAGCNNATATSFWDLPTSTPAVAACVTGTNTQKGVLQYADTSGGFSAQNELLLPADFSGAIDARIIWRTSATSGNAKFSLSTICTDVAATATDDPAFNTASTVTTVAPGTTLRLQTSAITGVTATGCSAGNFLHVKLFRDGNDGSDTLGASLDVIGVELTLRRAI